MRDRSEWNIRCFPFIPEVQSEGDSDADRAGDGIDTASVYHGLPYGAVLILVEHKVDESCYNPSYV